MTELGTSKKDIRKLLKSYTCKYISNLKEICNHWSKKVNIALEYPKILLIYLSFDSNKEDNNKDFKDNNAPKKP